MSEFYRRAGVDIDSGNEVVARIKDRVRRTFPPEVRTDLGTFGALFSLNTGKYEKPLLVSGTDGVGTKLKIAFAMEKNDTIGIDLVAMSVNDVLTMGAEPLFFLDYIACSKLVPDTIAEIIDGVIEGCLQAGCALIGGETAEMPGMYNPGEYDLAGFCVGVVDEAKVIDGHTISEGDVVVGLPSSGLHSNGYSLARKVLLEDAGLNLDRVIPELGGTLGEELLKPTRIYARILRTLLGEPNIDVKGIAHITGGGLIENVPRILPAGLEARIMAQSWPIPPVFKLIADRGNVPIREMYRVFNMGIGMTLVLPAPHVDRFLEKMGELGEKAYLIGEVQKGDNGVLLSRDGGGAFL